MVRVIGHHIPSIITTNQCKKNWDYYNRLKCDAVQFDNINLLTFRRHKQPSPAGWKSTVTDVLKWHRVIWIIRIILYLFLVELNLKGTNSITLNRLKQKTFFLKTVLVQLCKMDVTALKTWWMNKTYLCQGCVLQVLAHHCFSPYNSSIQNSSLTLSEKTARHTLRLKYPGHVKHCYITNFNVSPCNFSIQ